MGHSISSRTALSFPSVPLDTHPLIISAARHDPPRRLARDLGDQVEVLVVVQHRGVVNRCSRRNQEVGNWAPVVTLRSEALLGRERQFANASVRRQPHQRIE